MASVVINTRFNNRKAEADLKELQAKAKETAREINAVEKGLGSARLRPNGISCGTIWKLPARKLQKRLPLSTK